MAAEPRPFLFLLLLLSGFSAACDDSQAAGNVPAPAVIDSALPRDVALRRFRSGLTRPESLVHAQPSRDRLVRRFLAAVEAADTLALARMSITRAEFAWLFYPTSPYAAPPYDMSSELFWFTMDGNGAQGLGRLLREYGGRPMGFLTYRCPPEPAPEGENRLHAPCTVRFAPRPGDTVETRLFGPILEREGRFKFVNLANRLD